MSNKDFVDPLSLFYSIDAGMLELYRGGHQVALEIEGHNFRAIHPLGKVSIPNDLDEKTLFDYLVEVAAADPENLDVLGQPAQLCRTVEISSSTASACAASATPRRIPNRHARP